MRIPLWTVGGVFFCVSAMAAETQLFHPHVSLHASALSERVVEGDVVWTHLSERGGDQHFVLPLNFKEAPNMQVSSVARAEDFFNAWEATRTEVTGVWDCDGKALEWFYASAKPVLQTYSLEHVYMVVRGAGSCVKMSFRTSFAHQSHECGYWKGSVLCGYGWFPSPRFWEEKGWSDRLIPVEFSYDAHFKSTEQKTFLLGEEVCVNGSCGGLDAQGEGLVRGVPLVWGEGLHVAYEDIGGVRVSVLNRHHGGFWDAYKKTQRAVLAMLKRVLAYEAQMLGAYPYKALTVVETAATHQPWAGHGVVFLDDAFFAYNQSWVALNTYDAVAEVFLARWVAHQWWGQKRVADPAESLWVTSGLSWAMAMMYGEEVLQGRTGYQTHAFSRAVFDGMWGRAPGPNWRKHVWDVAYENHARFKVDEALSLRQEALKHVEENTYRQEQKAGKLFIDAVERWGGFKAHAARWMGAYQEAGSLEFLDARWLETHFFNHGENTQALLHQNHTSSLLRMPQQMGVEGGLGGGVVSVDKHAIAWNMLPLEEGYVVGSHVSGHHGVWLDWKFAGGIKRVWWKGDGYDTVLQPGVSGVVWMPLARRSGLETRMSMDTVRGHAQGNLYLWHVEQRYRHAFFYGSNVGQVGRYQLPRTYMDIGVSYQHQMVEGIGKTWTFKDTRYHEGPGGMWLFQLTQDESVRLGWKGSLGVFGGVRAPWYKWFFGGHLKSDNVFVLPYAGRLGVGFDAMGVSPGAAVFDRLALDRMPAYAQSHMYGPYDMAFSGAVTWSWPLLRALRFRQELLLNTFVLDDVSVVWHYGAACGGVFTPPSDMGWWDRTSPTHMEWLGGMGEVGGALDMRIGTFAGAWSLRGGLGVSVWPSPDVGHMSPFIHITWGM